MSSDEPESSGGVDKLGEVVAEAVLADFFELEVVIVLAEELPIPGIPFLQKIENKEVSHISLTTKSPAMHVFYHAQTNFPAVLGTT